MKGNSLPKISIIGIDYAQEKYVERTIKSVLNQKYPNLEYVLIDDSFPNKNSQPILKEYKEKHPQSFSWIDLPKTSQYRKLNHGLKLIKGDIVASINSDDLHIGKSLQKVAEVFLNNPEIKWVVGRAKIINDKDREIRKPITVWKNFWLKFFSYPLLLSLNPISHCAVYIRKEIMEEIGDFNEEYPICADYEYWLRVAKKYPPYILNDYIAAFRVHGGGQGASKFIKQFREEIKYAQRFTNNPVWIGIHWLNYLSIVLIYSVLRFLNK